MDDESLGRQIVAEAVKHEMRLKQLYDAIGKRARGRQTSLFPDEPKTVVVNAVEETPPKRRGRPPKAIQGPPRQYHKRTGALDVIAAVFEREPNVPHSYVSISQQVPQCPKGTISATINWLKVKGKIVAVDRGLYKAAKAQLSLAPAKGA